MRFRLFCEGVPPCGRAYFFLLRQEKVAKKKATPGSAPGYARSLALLGSPGTPRVLPRAASHRSGRGLLNSPAAQTTQAEGPRPACVAQRLSWGPKSVTERWLCPRKKRSVFCGQLLEKAKNRFHRFSRGALPGPLGGAEQRRSAGGLRRALFEGRSPELRSRPAFRVAQGTPEGGADPGSPFLCLLSFGEAKESETPRKAENSRKTTAQH